MSSDLVPGDIVEVEDHCVFSCDLVLLQGGCVVNESMLTGESVPVVKSALELPTGRRCGLFFKLGRSSE